jgi:DNA-binding NtrC family response regulator
MDPQSFSAELSPDRGPADRDATLLLEALTEALGALTLEGNSELALQRSFGSAQRGLRARKGLLLVVRDVAPPEFEILYASGLTADEQEACRRMESLHGVSPSVIRTAIESGRPVFIPNSQLRGRPFDRTASLSEGTHSVLCAPVSDPLTRVPIAVLYFQNEGLAEAFQEQHETWLRSYTSALSQGLGLHLQAKRRFEGLEKERRRLAESLGEGPELIGDSEEMGRLRHVLHEVLIPAAEIPNPKPILVLGPRGTGKDLVARYLHYYSARRRQGRFVSFNCAGLRGDLAEARVFGFVKGAFTGADRESLGLFREADGGVLFLDEIGQMPIEGQALLLRAIESRRVQAVGSAKEVAVDVQLLSATNRDLRAEVQAGRFLPDLFDRIRALTLELKPLVSPTRRSDLRALVSHFLAVYERAHHKKTLGLTREATLALLNYSWPGNVREVDNLCAALIAYARPGVEIALKDVLRHVPDLLEPQNRHPDAPVLADEGATYDEAFVSWEREFMRRRIEQQDGHHTRTMKSLALPRATYYRVLKRCGLRSPEGDADE